MNSMVVDLLLAVIENDLMVFAMALDSSDNGKKLGYTKILESPSFR